MTDLAVLPVPRGSAAREVLPTLRRVLDGSVGAVLPVPADDARETTRLTSALSPGTPIDDGVAMVVATSGSTGVPKGALLTVDALRASADATHRRLGGPGAWLLALPAHHIAGLQVLLRSIAAGAEPTIVDVADGFDPRLLVEAEAEMHAPRRYTSLVPTQLIKVLEQPDAAAALARFDAVLLGGAATPAPVLARARDAGIPVVRTYGMSETCGGCVYDGIALDGVEVRIDDGRVVLGGATLASGYRGMPDHPAFAEPGWFRTDDAGTVDTLPGGRRVLRIVGRIDDAITTGGLTVVPQVVEAVLAELDGVAECVVVGVPDDRLGHRVAALIVPGPGTTPTADAVRAAVTDALGRAAAPREIRFVEALPLRGPGKVDRAAARARLLTL